MPYSACNWSEHCDVPESATRHGWATYLLTLSELRNYLRTYLGQRLDGHRLVEREAVVL